MSINYWCAVCNEQITGYDIEDRHSDEYGEDIHSYCCEQCNKHNGEPQCQQTQKYRISTVPSSE